MKTIWIQSALLLLIVLLWSCSPDNRPSSGDESSPADTSSDSSRESSTRSPREREIQQLPSGPLAVNCVLTPEKVRQACSLDSRVNLQSTREDLPSAYNHRCWIVSLRDFTQEAYPPLFSTEKNSILGYDADYLSELKKSSFEELKRIEVGTQPSRDLQLGEASFVAARPTYRQLIGQEEPVPLDEAKELAMFAYQDGIVYQLLFSGKGTLITGQTGISEVIREELPVCSIEEATVLMQKMIDSMLGSSSSQSYSGCALTTNVIEERCGITLQGNIGLFSRFLDNECQINAREAAGFPVASFKEISPQQFALSATLGEEVSGIADQAYLRETQTGFKIYFKTGSKAGVFSAFSEQGQEEVYVIDVPTQEVLPLGGACSKDEAKDIVSAVLVPYLQG